jgi:hypothetical protein
MEIMGLPPPVTAGLILLVHSHPFLLIVGCLSAQNYVCVSPNQGMVGLRLGARHGLYGNGPMASGISPLTRKADNSMKGTAALQKRKRKQRERQAK